MSKQTLTGGCYCGHARYEASIKLPEPLVANRCNCTFCTKAGQTGLPLESPADYKLLQPASESELLCVVKNVKGVQHMACPKCAIHLFIRGDFMHGEHHMKFFMLNLSTLDQPQEGIDLSQLKFRYNDGLKDNFTEQADTPFPGGMA